jgi:hypothetical protein
MSRTVGVVLVLLLALPALADDDKPKDKPKTPEEQYKALLQEKGDPAKEAPKFLELAEKNPKDAVAVDALAWVLSHTPGLQGDKDSPRAKAAALLLRDHVQSDKLASVCQGLGNGYDKEGAELLRGVLSKNPHKDVQAEACAALAQRTGVRVQVAHLLKDNPGDAKRLERFFGKEQIEELQKADVAKVEAESAAVNKEFAEKYAAQMKPQRVTLLCQLIGRSGGTAGEALMRALMEKDTRKDVQGVACLMLGQSLKGRADALPKAKAEDAEKLRKESEQFFQRVVDKYADVKLNPRLPSIGDQAKGELFEMRHLAIGMVVPDIEDEDIDGKKFKLSDYRGKVVLIDFWGDW